MDTLKRLAAPPLSRHSSRNHFIVGLRGLFVIQSFLFVFLQVFAPASVAHSQNALHVNNTSKLHKVLKLISILFWNDGIIYSAFILISARTICIPFMQDGAKTSIAGSVFRRTLRLCFPIAVAMALITTLLHVIGYDYIQDFANETGNQSILVPYKIDNAIVYFNSVFNLFWVTNKFSDQAGSYAFPGQMMWTINVIYMQRLDVFSFQKKIFDVTDQRSSFTIYMTMAIIPYTRHSWRVKSSIFFIITAWWVQSWAWFSITGLLLADMTANMDFKAKAQRGFKVWRSIRCPSYAVYLVVLAAGLIMQYLWVTWRPNYYDNELVVHGGLYYTGGLNENFDVKQPQARDDNYLVLLGFFLFVETSDILQWALANPLFVYLGRRSLSKHFVTHLRIIKVDVARRLVSRSKYRRVRPRHQALPDITH